MLRDQNAAELASASVNRTETEKQRDEYELKTVLEKERKDKLEKLKKYSGSRHSRFGGRFVVSGMKSIGENEMVISSMTSNVNKAFDRYKVYKDQNIYLLFNVYHLYININFNIFFSETS